MDNLTLDSLDKKIRRLPSLPAIVTDILAMLEQGNLNISALEDKLKQDQSLSAQTLRIANSAFYGFSRNVGTIREATVLLGVHAVRNIVTAASVVNQFPGNEHAGLDRAKFWQHSIGTSIAARVLARHSALDQELAFTAGLLHDIGKLALDTYFPEQYKTVLSYQKENDCLLREAEIAVLGFDHALVGATLTRTWKLPPLIVEAIEMHHQPEAGSSSSLVALIHAADIICRGLNIGNGGDDLIPSLSLSALTSTGHDWNTVKGCFQEIEECSMASSMLVDSAA